VNKQLVKANPTATFQYQIRPIYVYVYVSWKRYEQS